MSWIWVPNKTLGPIKLGENISNYINSLNLIEGLKSNAAVGWEEYCTSDDNICLEVEEGIVVAIMSFSECFYKEQNIIGMPLSCLETLLGQFAIKGEDVLYDDGQLQTTFEFTSFGLLVWTSENRQICSVSISAYG